MKWGKRTVRPERTEEVWGANVPSKVMRPLGELMAEQPELTWTTQMHVSFNDGDDRVTVGRTIEILPDGTWVEVEGDRIVEVRKGRARS